MSQPDFIGDAIKIAQQAIELDKAGDYEKAFETYERSLRHFIVALKYIKNPQSEQIVRQKVKQYFTRAEELKELLRKRKNGGSTPAAGGGGGGARAGVMGSNGAAAGDTGEKKDELDADAKKLRGALQGAVLTEKPNVRWEDVAGLDSAKEALKEAVILPIKFPHLFTGKRKPWKGILLYGPPGTGKSYLAKAVATEANSTFFSISSSDLVSKWMGESERLVKQLFAMARENKPSIIFIDEVDALCGSRGEGESEASRRIKTEMLVQMDGVGHDSSSVLVLGATNIPWQLDSAIRRRFQRRVHIGLPDLSARVTMFQLAIGNTPNDLTKDDIKKLAGMTEGFSGSDIAIVVQDALMQPLRLIQSATHYKQVRVPAGMPGEGKVKWTPCSPGDEGAREMSWMEIEGEELLEPGLGMRDFVKAVRNSKPTVSREDMERSEEWTREFGSEG
ncbi:putative vacuolar sorting ATPase Vps4 [Ascobolus immersus RN42]|uniref:vesicle-fusing ATPase n=1 Tax=Ascobolus immersus RN42 TaxID=1160509 RepID=A0A3N4HP15_ASCIM|nr:putative vacuolar sorting ATPase Vps4 [Ascobolus immersus RN42]